jgi:hypothetical protein
MAAPTQQRRALIQAALVVTVIASQAAACGEIRYRDSIVAETPIQRIEINSDAGIIEVVPGDVARIDYAVRAPEGTAMVQHTELDGVLVINSRCRTPILCSVDTELHVPEGVEVAIILDRGEVWATGVGALNVSLAEGVVDIETTGTTTVQIGKGSARVVASGSEQLRVAVGHGDIEVQAAPIAWNISIVAANESVTGVAHDPSALGAMELVAPAGRVSVRGLIQAGEAD